MKKLFVFSILCLFFVTGFTQEITSSLDKFTHQKRLSSDKINLWGKGFTSNGVKMSIRSVDSSIFLIVYGNVSGTVSEKDPLYILTDVGNIILFPTHIQTSSRYWNDNYWIERYDNEYSISYKQVVSLSQNKIKSIRRYYNDVYQEFDVRESHNSNLINLCSAFLVEYKQQPFSGLVVGNIEKVKVSFERILSDDELNTIIFSTHDINLAVELADSIYLIGRPEGADYSTILKHYDLKQMGLAWTPYNAQHAALVAEIKNIVVNS